MEKNLLEPLYISGVYLSLPRVHYRTADNTTIFLNKEGNTGRTVHESFENNLRAFLILSPAN
jgi:hypothetical protein